MYLKSEKKLNSEEISEEIDITAQKLCHDVVVDCLTVLLKNLWEMAIKSNMFNS